MTAPLQMSDPSTDRSPRILQVLYSFRVGGSEVVALELAHQLARAGADVLCSALDGMNGSLRNLCGELNLPVVDLGLPVRNPLGRNGLSLRLAMRLAALRLDAIHLHHFVALNKLGLPARLAGVRRIVVTEHSETQLRESVAGRVRLRLNWRLAHRITVIHEGIRQYLNEEIGIPADRIAVIPNGLDVERWRRDDRMQRRSELGVHSKFTFVFVGRVAEVKNVPGLISAFLTAQLRLPERAVLIVVGDGPDMPKCRSLLADHPLAHTVVLAGEQSDTRRYLAAADAFVMNSRSEGTPRALLEAMCTGLPAICTAVGGVSEILRGRGWLTTPGDPESLVAALLDVIAHPAKRSTLGAHARSFITANYNSRDVLRCYQRLLLEGHAPVSSTDGMDRHRTDGSHNERESSEPHACGKPRL